MMTRKGKPTPVSRGDFLDGPDTMLWNPTLTSARCRGETLRALTTRHTVLSGLFGAGSLTLGIARATGGAAVLFLAVGVLALCSGALTAATTLGSITTDHRHPHGTRCSLEQRPGAFFYRTNDFADLGTSTHDTVTLLIDAVDELTTTLACGWLDPELPHQAHQVVWDTLYCLDRTRPARALVTQLAREPGEVELAGSAADAVEAIDAGVAEVVFHLLGCLTLTRAWETKLHHHDVAARTDTVLASLREIPLAPVVAAAESLPHSVFAHLTAARDVTDTGPFRWEDPETAARVACWRSVTVPPPGHDRHQPTATDTAS
jgi:hypothetical protein